MISHILRVQFHKHPHAVPRQHETRKKMALFLSTHINRIDKKGRVSVPASFRNALDQDSFNGIIAFRSYKLAAIEGVSMQRMKLISESVDNLDLFSEDQDDFASTIFADAHQLNFDSDGRIILPDDLREHADLKDQVAFVGRGTTFQLWNPDAFAQHQQTARQRVHDKRATIKLKTEESKT